MGTIINFQCESCDFTFQDKDLIFYLNEDSLLIEETLSMENSNAMTKSLLSGFLYESYCPSCDNLIKTYVPEMNNTNLEESEIKEIINKSNGFDSNYEESNLGELSSEVNNFKTLIFDFNNTTYKDRRNVLENNTCPICDGEISLVISENVPCPKCGNKLKETY